MAAPGEVVRIRVNPQDSMSVADIVRITGFNYTGMSFSVACSIALSALLETMREQGRVPRRAGFEYNDIMEPFGIKNRTSRKLAIAKALTYAGDEARVPAIPVTEFHELTREQRAAKRLMDELHIKQEHAPDSWTSGDEERWTRANAVYFGDLVLQPGEEL